MEVEPLWGPFSTASAFLFGLLFGSFANVLAYRIPRHISIVMPGSFCPVCGRNVRWFDNVPILSFLWLRGRCRDCSAPISWRYPAVELSTGLLTAWIVARFGLTGEALLFVYVGVVLVVLFLTDLDFHTLPDELTVTGIAAGLLVAIASGAGLIERTRGARTFPESALGVTGGAGVLLLIMFIYQVVRDRPGMGVGDVKLMAFIGAFLAIELAMASLLVAVILGCVGGLLFVAVRGGNLQTALPFGTYLACATFLVVFFYES